MPLKIDSLIASSVTVNGIPGNLPYKVYIAKLTQVGTDAPIPTVLTNTLGGELVWTRDGEGAYLGTLVGGFPDENKVYFGLGFNPGGSVDGVFWNSEDVVEITTDGVDESLEDVVEIRVFL
jgi:hypothetical protein